MLPWMILVRTLLSPEVPLFTRIISDPRVGFFSILAPRRALREKRGGGGRKTQTFQITSLPGDQQPGEFQNDDNLEGQESRAGWLGYQGNLR